MTPEPTPATCPKCGSRAVPGTRQSFVCGTWIQASGLPKMSDDCERRCLIEEQRQEIESLKAEHEVMADRLIELEEIAYDDSGKLYWRSCGDRLFDPTGESP